MKLNKEHTTRKVLIIYLKITYPGGYPRSLFKILRVGWLVGFCGWYSLLKYIGPEYVG